MYRYFKNLRSSAYKIPKQVARKTENLCQINTSIDLIYKWLKRSGHHEKLSL